MNAYLSPDLACEKSGGALQDLVLLLEPVVLPPQTGSSAASTFCLASACRQNLVAPAPKLVGVNAHLLGNRLQRATARLVEFDRLRFVLRREMATLPLRHLSSLLVRTTQTCLSDLP